MSLLIYIRHRLLPTQSSLHLLPTFAKTACRNMSTPAPQKPHPLEFLIGTWTGRGRGYFPTIPSFEFFEEVTFVKDPAGRPVVQYTQKTRRAVPTQDASKGELSGQGEFVPAGPLHAELGFIRLPGWSHEKCELILSQPTGVASVEEGKIHGTTVDWTATSIIRSPTAKPPHVTEFTRKWEVDPESKTFKYLFSMATESTPLQPHLEVTMTKVDS